MYKNFVIASAKEEANNIAAEVIKKGGNICAAAVAAAFALSVCEPHASGLGGGGFINYYDAKNNKSVFIDFREKCVNYKKESFFKENKLICVPGELKGLTYFLKKYGNLSLSEVLQDSIKLCEEGFKLTKTLERVIYEKKDKIMQDDELKKIYFKKDFSFFSTGEKIKNENLANTYKKLKKHGEETFYNGDLSKKIIKSAVKKGFYICKDDLKNYNIVKTKALDFYFDKIHFLLPPLPSAGGLCLAMMLNIAENLNYKELMENDIIKYHYYSEIFKICYNNRLNYLDVNTSKKIQKEIFLSKKYSKKLYDSITKNKVNFYRNKKINESFSTTHFSIMSKDGSAVSITKTINSYFGSFCGVDGCGFPLNNSADDFNYFLQYNKNLAEPLKKPLSSMTPIIAIKDKKAVFALGSPGGIRIPLTVFQILINFLKLNKSMRESIDELRVFNDVDEIFLYESGLKKSVIKELEKIGHICKEHKDHFSCGDVHAVYQKENLLYGESDFRKDGNVLGF